MKFFTFIPTILLSLAIAAPSEKRATPHVYLAGDSTMALGGGGSGTQGTVLCHYSRCMPSYNIADVSILGWGVYLPDSLTGVAVESDAVAGRSARSYYSESRFTAIADKVVSGDWVIIEFGHNDGGMSSTFIVISSLNPAPLIALRLSQLLLHPTCSMFSR